MSNNDEIKQALSHVDSTDRETWLRMGAGIKTELGEDGFNLWDGWSQKAENYNEKAAKSAWKSLKPGRVNIGSVFFEAKRAGYVAGTPYTPPSAEEQAARAEQRRIAEEKALAERAIEAAQAKAEAQTRWDKAGAADPKHPYLVVKGITDLAVIGAIRQEGNQLLVPLRKSKELVAVQSIGPNGFKSFAEGSQVQGSAFLIGHPKNATSERGVLVAEGFATAASLHQATGQPVLMAVHAYNMKPVAEALKDTMQDIPITFCADNDANGVGINYADQAAQIVGDKAHAVMPEFTDADFAAFRQKHGPEAIPSDFNDLAQVRGLEAVQEAAKPPQIQQETPAIEESETPAMPASVFGQQEINRIEPDLEQVIEQAQATDPVQQPARAVEQEAQGIGQRHAAPTVEPSVATDAVAGETAIKKPVLDLAYKAPPDGLEVRYLFVDGKYVDAGNGVTTIFQDKGKYLSTTKEDIQTVHDMVEVAKAKGWERLKLSGTPEFKRLMFIEAESQGIKTRGHQPTPEDLAMVNKRLEERSLNQVQPDLTREKAMVSGQADDKRGSPQRKDQPELPSGILVNHGAAPYLHDDKNKPSYFVTLSQGETERTIWGVGLPAAIKESEAKIGDDITLKNLGREPVEVDQPVYGDDGKTVIGHETVLTHRNAWEVTVLNQEQEKASEPKQEKSAMADARAISAADRLVSQNEMPTQAHIETSAKADIDTDVRMAVIGGQSVPSQVKIAADQMRSVHLNEQQGVSKQGIASRLNPASQANFRYMQNMAKNVISYLRHDRREDAHRNFNTNMEKAVNGTTLNVPEPMRERVEQSAKKEHQQEREHQKDLTLDR
ncbi:putative DNA primase/helicase [Advenella incenata]|uniref:Putative DNA primase/helicase n=1 Tax=Advenella incenata TaxID=267800 RepID=A0A4Q7V4D1_9BURK|nr:LPD7 domain-containing protein [Advenella incenata]RZT91065.1 putative DNA primase/helicase [Advenella incenata]